VHAHRQPIPVDKLLFLEARERGKKGEAATLVSSEAGYLYWWNLWMSPHEMGEAATRGRHSLLLWGEH